MILKRNYILTVSILAASLTSFHAEASSYEDKKCEEAKSSTKALSEKVFSIKNPEGESLKELEQVVQKAKALEAIYNTLNKLERDRDDFYRKLNPMHENSFFSDSQDLAKNYESVQKEILSNHVLAGVSSSINAILNSKDRDLLYPNTDNFIAHLASKEDEKITAFEDIVDQCKRVKKETGKKLESCKPFFSNDKLIDIEFINGPNFLKDVTNNFFRAAAQSVRNGDKVDFKTLEAQLDEIKKSTILSKIDIDDLKNKNVSLMGAIEKIESVKKFGSNSNVSANLLLNKVSTEASDKKEFTTENLQTRNDKYSNEELGQLSKAYEEAKKCFTKTVLVNSSSESCNSKDNKENFKDFLSDIHNFSKSPSAKNQEVEAIFNDMKNRANNSAKDSKGKLFKDPKMMSALSKMKLLGKNNSFSEGLSKLCNVKFNDKITPETINNSQNSSEREKVWNCINEDKQAALEESRENALNAKKKIAKIHEQEEYKTYNDLLTYSAFVANNNCKDKTAFLKTCGGRSNSFTSLTLGDSSILTNISKLDWKMQGQGKTKKALEPLNSKCSSLKRTISQEKQATEQTGKTNTNEVLNSAVNDVCHNVGQDYTSVVASRPTPKQKEFQKKYISKYNPYTGKMDKKERRSIATKIGTSAAKSLLNNGLPLMFSNMQFKNNLPYTTNSAIYRKNQLYFLNNPEYMYPSSYFSGYGMTGGPAYYGATPAYYGF